MCIRDSYYAYQIKANKSKLDYLMKKAKEQGIALDTVSYTHLEEAILPFPSSPHLVPTTTVTHLFTFVTPFAKCEMRKVTSYHKNLHKNFITEL